jgi:hypothetical protein
MMHPLAALIALAVGLALVIPAMARAAGPPRVGATWSTAVSASAATVHAEVNPEGAATAYRFEYIPAGPDYQAHGFEHAAKQPAGAPIGLGEGSVDVQATQHLVPLQAATLYHYRILATSHCNPLEPAEVCTVTGPDDTFTTQEAGAVFSLPDNRGWEMVSPIDKNGGAIQGPGQNFGGDVLQAAALGGAVTYSSAASFGPGAQGAPPASQYLSRRGPGSGGWSTENLTVPIFSASYGDHPDGVPYRLFSTDLARALMLNGQRCRGEVGECPVANPSLPGSGAPAGYQDYYLRESESGGFTALITAVNAELGLGPEQLELSFAGASPDLRHVVLSTCAALTPDATEQPACESGGPNLYEWSEGTLRLINRLGSDSFGTSDAHLAAQSGAVSADGQRIYFTLGEEAALYLREGEAGARLVSQLSSFQTASSDGSVAFYTKEEGGSGKHLYRYEANGEHTTDLTPSGEVQGVLGASEDGSHVYYQDAAGLEEWHAGATTQLAPGPQAAQESDWPPTTGTARVSADGETLLFLSKESLTGYDNTDATTGLPDSEVFLYDATGALACLSCDPTNARPLGPSTIPGAIANGTTDSYKPRVLSADGARVFFDSADALAPFDTNNRPDVYQWEAPNAGTCQRPGGCLNLVSSGRGAEGASFIDASADGADAFFLTTESLVPADPGSADLYDARVGGGFPESPPPIECLGDACQPLPEAPEDPTAGTSIPGLPNPPVHFPKPSCPKGKVRRHGRCVRKSPNKRHGHHRGGKK